ncbi:hypothetical protein PHLCEN_2v1178 [Hermanssonia centrifuga]|uniref:Uncharacterized protein n=1 Tax=Hermanssonia centrifuga TaxID=98765 RepID=A0A2R6S3W8_9APHY|nr:hypothetical protein PHLCEN_2v1178 [Hermanssonia centrifuga]
MGISGLLPLLKPIQVDKHLSEYSGQTIAVDAYVWLHRGVYACATELATGKRTNKYVDYAMHRVRLLRHHNITPYIVFDGGPLPAKKGTESDRKKKREENLARANALAAQGKHTQARDFYVKCADVTPQMAFQFIKALRAEAVSYVVAPYEADAQMAYMERIGLVQGIMTEDSDLLVFGCRNVLLKLDAVESTVTSISRDDFASFASPAGISFLGWSDVQFRAMAILSGCDYLPSIPGIGLRTAYALLKKHRTAENVIRTLQAEGKKVVPKGYLQAFKLAEKVFLHQRVYDPTLQVLVNLTEIPGGESWDEENEAHVGGYIEPVLAKEVAEGDVCPITLLPMEDINPTFVPRALKPIPMNSMNLPRSDARKGKGKMILPEKAKSTSLLTFFSPKSKMETPPKSSSRPTPPHIGSRAKICVPIAGRSSGKRTLADLMEEDMSAKRKKHNDKKRPTDRTLTTATSKFFSGTSLSIAKDKPVRNVSLDIAGPSRLQHFSKGKENICSFDEDDVDEISMDEDPDPVSQEEGYISPSSSSFRWESPELSSPLRPGSSSFRLAVGAVDDDFEADILSSPLAAGTRRQQSRRPQSCVTGRVLVHGTPQRSRVKDEGAPGPDLRDIFEDWNDLTSEIDECCEDSMESLESSSGPVTPVSSSQPAGQCVDDIFDEVTPDDEEIEQQAVAARNESVASGWWQKWSCGNATPLQPPSSNLRIKSIGFASSGYLHGHV